MSKTYAYKYPMPCVTTDVILIGYDVEENDLRLLLIKRKVKPFADHWALPGGHIAMDETLEETALRELQEETGIAPSDVHLEQVYTFGNPGRDPRGRYITVAYMALVNLANFPNAKAGSDAKETLWASIEGSVSQIDGQTLVRGKNKIPHDSIAFDHGKIIQMAIERLKSKIVYQPVVFSLLPKEFTLTTLQKAYETILDRPLDKRNFRKKILAMGILKPCKIEKGTAHRPAKLYQFDGKEFWAKKENGFFFEL